MNEVRQDSWHLDKRVPIALILGLVLQAAGFGWFAATLDGRIAQNSREIVRIDSRSRAMQEASQVQAVQLGRIEEQISGLRNDVARVIAVLERARDGR